MCDDAITVSVNEKTIRLMQNISSQAAAQEIRSRFRIEGGFVVDDKHRIVPPHCILNAEIHYSFIDWSAKQPESGLPVALKEFRFPSAKTKPFPKRGIGSMLLNRKALVSKFVDEVLVPSYDTHNFYICGPRGNGKTVFLYLVGRELQRRGHKVLMIEHASDLSTVEKAHFEILEKSLDPGERLYLLIDEVQSFQSSPRWNYLLADTDMIVTIGAGIPSGSGVSPAFLNNKEVTFLMLTADDFDEEFVDRLRHMSGIEEVGDVRRILSWLVKLTGGHTYPLLQLAHHLFSEHQEKCRIGDLAKLDALVKSRDVLNSPICQEIATRCFEATEPKVLKTVDRVLQHGTVSSVDIRILDRNGLWICNWLRSWFLSPLFLSHMALRTFGHGEPLEIDSTSPNDALEVVQRVILRGLLEMNADDFKEPGGRYENAIGCIFQWHLNTKIRGLLVSPQTPQIDQNKVSASGPRPTIDMYLNGKLDVFLELTRNGVDLEGHFDKFEDAKGAYKSYADRYAILDFELDRPSPVQMPDKYNTERHRQKLFTYVLRSNALYRGNELVKSGVSKYVKTPSLPSQISRNHNASKGVRGFSTLNRSVRMLPMLLKRL